MLYVFVFLSVVFRVLYFIYLKIVCVMIIINV